MNLILNDISLQGQFSNLDEFTDEINTNLLPLLKTAKDLSLSILKDSTTYSRLVTEDMILADVIQTKGDPDILALKKYLVDISYNEPYWNDDIQTDCSCGYLCKYVEYVPNCFTETCERDGILISFRHEYFVSDYLYLSKNGEEKSIKNCINKYIFLNHLYESKIINTIYYFKNLNEGIAIRFDEDNHKCYSQDAFDENNINNEDLISIKNDILSMINSILRGVRTRFSKPMGDSLFEFRTSISDGREFRLFYMYGASEIVFLNGCIKKSQKTPKTDLNVAKRLAKKYQ